jgi:hypothetical protein
MGLKIIYLRSFIDFAGFFYYNLTKFMRIIVLFSFLFLAQIAIGQTTSYATIDQKMAAIPENQTATTSGIADYINSNFKTETEKIRAVFYWTASNISYDVPNMYQLNTDSSQLKIENALKLRAGVCIHYSEIFNDIANKVGVKTFIIGGYTKQNNQLATLAHAWNASQVDGKWFLFDATWGAGFVEKNLFTKKLNNAFFKVEPSKMIASHMPFDYMWQFLNSPITNQEFISGKSDTNKAKINFDYVSEISKYEKLNNSDKAFETAARIEKNGLLNNMIVEHYNYKKKEFTVINQNKSVEKLIEITANFNESIRDLNDFIFFRNKRFQPKQTDETLKKMMQDVKDKMNKCKDDVYNINNVSPENASNLSNLKRAILEGIDKMKEQDDFLKEYLSKNGIGRKLMFTNLR